MTTQPRHPMPTSRTKRAALSTIRKAHPGTGRATSPTARFFHVQNFMVLGAGNAYPQGRQHGVIHVFGPASILSVRKAQGMVPCLITEPKP